MNKQELIEKIKANGEWLETNRYVEITKAIKLINQIDEPQKVKVPEKFDEWYKEIEKSWADIESAKQFALWKICQYGFGCGFEDVNGNRTSNTLSDWVSNHREDAINAVWHGYEVEPPKWIVKKKNGDYVEGYANATTSFTIYIDSHLDSTTPHKFTKLAKAEAVAYLVNGTVEKV